MKLGQKKESKIEKWEQTCAVVNVPYNGGHDVVVTVLHHGREDVEFHCGREDVKWKRSHRRVYCYSCFVGHCTSSSSSSMGHVVVVASHMFVVRGTRLTSPLVHSGGTKNDLGKGGNFVRVK